MFSMSRDDLYREDGHLARSPFSPSEVSTSKSSSLAHSPSLSNISPSRCPCTCPTPPDIFVPLAPTFGDEAGTRHAVLGQGSRGLHASSSAGSFEVSHPPGDEWGLKPPDCLKSRSRTFSQHVAQPENHTAASFFHVSCHSSIASFAGASGSWTGAWKRGQENSTPASASFFRFSFKLRFGPSTASRSSFLGPGQDRLTDPNQQHDLGPLVCTVQLASFQDRCSWSRYPFRGR